MEKLSVVIITYNEENNIGQCLESVEWADEIVVVDSLSTDRTVDIAKDYTDKIYPRAWEGYGKQKKYAVGQASNRWVLSLDADERITDELKLEIIEVLGADQITISGYEIPRKAFFGDTWVRHGGWYPDYVLRLFRKDQGCFSERLVHETVEISGSAGRLKHCIEHYPYRSISDFVVRMERYSTLSAQVYYQEGRRVGWFETILRSWFTFIQMILLQRGFLDGVLGFELACFYSFYTFLKYAKLIELNSKSEEKSGVVEAVS